MNEIYEDLEILSLTSKSNFELKDFLNNAKNNIIDNNQLENIKLLEWEISIFLFNINKNKLKGCFFGTDEKGLQTEYPTLNLYTPEAFEYIKERAVNCHSPFLKSRYSHFLWLSPEKNIKYARLAIDSYLLSISKIEELDNKFPDKYYGLNLLATLLNLFPLATSINYKVENVKSEIKRILLNYPLDESSSYVMRLDLTQLMLDNKKFFIPKDFKNIVAILEKLVVNKSTNDKEHAIVILKQIISVKKRLNQKSEKYEKKIGYLWYKKSIEKDQLNIVACKFLENSITQYKKLKDTKKINFLQKKYNNLKKDIELIPIGEEIEISEHYRNFRKIAQSLSIQSTESIIHFLMNDNSLLPIYEQIEQQVDSQKGKYLFKELFSNSIIDSYGNTVQHFDDETEKKYFDILQFYNYDVQIFRLPFLQQIFYECVKKQKLDAKKILHYLYSNSWLGVEFEISTNNQRKTPYNWLSLVAPSLNEFFVNLEFHLINPTLSQNFILCVDSLSTKIEGLIRDICEFNGIVPFEFKQDHKGRNISFQKDIHKLLNEKEIIDLISKDDLLLLKYTLIEKAGLNLRHKVAHSLMKYEEYNIGQMFLLIICVLKLGKYNFTKK